MSSNPLTLLLPTATINLGGRDPALIEARVDLRGLTVHLTGAATPDRLAALTRAIPQFADDLPEVLIHPQTPPSQPLRLDLTATRPWLGPQSWQENTPAPHKSTRNHR